MTALITIQRPLNKINKNIYFLALFVVTLCQWKWKNTIKKLQYLPIHNLSILTVYLFFFTMECHTMEVSVYQNWFPTFFKILLCFPEESQDRFEMTWRWVNDDSVRVYVYIFGRRFYPKWLELHLRHSLHSLHSDIHVHAFPWESNLQPWHCVLHFWINYLFKDRWIQWCFKPKSVRIV